MDKALATQLANIEKRSGKSLDARVTDVAEVNPELIAWIRRAYEAAG